MTVFYEKRGRRYFPVSEYNGDWYSSLPAGSHLIHVEPGIRSTLHNVNPARAEVLAALREGRDAAIAAVLSAWEAKPSRGLTPKEREAFAEYKRILGDDDASLTLWRASASDVVDALEAAILSRVK